MTSADDPAQWQTDKLSALRFGRRLVAEIPASGPGRRSFVDIRPIGTDADREAHREGWSRPGRDRTFKLEHWEYDADQMDGFDYDIGAVLVRTALATDEEQLAEVLQSWKLSPGQFLYPWQTGDPK